MKSSRILLTTAAVLIGLTMAIHDADAKRMGGGRSIGRQSDNVTQKAAPPTQQSAPSQPAQSASPSTPAAQPQAPAPRPANRWLGPLAGLAAGLGIAALLSHFGLGGAAAEFLGSMLLIGGLVLLAVFLFRMFRRSSQPPQPAYAGAAENAPRTFDNVSERRAEPGFTPAFGPQAASAAPAPAAATNQGTWILPAGFDAENFLHIAKMYFVRLQAAWDSGNERDLRDFMTPEMYAEIKLDLQKRGDAPNQTDVVTLNAELLGVEELPEQTLASVRLTGTLREAPNATPEPFSEVWNLVKPKDAKASWVLAGIQQEA
jgi:predicted lipid-binding transport protein (Tim44 family)